MNDARGQGSVTVALRYLSLTILPLLSACGFWAPVLEVEIPEDYRGPVVIVFLGAPEDGVRAAATNSPCRVPPNGVVRISGNAPRILRSRFWLVRRDGMREEVREDRADDGAIGVHRVLLGGSSRTALSFIVCPREDVEKFEDARQRLLRDETM